MKIYIDDYEPSNLSDKLIKLEKYLFNSCDYVEIYSDDGIFYIDELGIYKIIVIKDECIKYTSAFSNLKFLLDKTRFYKENVTSIPLNHINNKIYKHEYKIDIKSKIKLIIEGIIHYHNDTNLLINNNKLNLFIPLNFYFELSDKDIDLNEIFNNNDLNVFLSLLK